MPWLWVITRSALSEPFGYIYLPVYYTNLTSNVFFYVWDTNYYHSHSRTGTGGAKLGPGDNCPVVVVTPLFQFAIWFVCACCVVATTLGWLAYPSFLLPPVLACLCLMYNSLVVERILLALLDVYYYCWYLGNKAFCNFVHHVSAYIIDIVKRTCVRSYSCLRWFTLLDPKLFPGVQFPRWRSWLLLILYRHYICNEYGTCYHMGIWNV